MPAALTWGVDFDLFWNLNPKTIKPFKKAYEQSERKEVYMMRYQSWLSGIYVMSAISSCFGKGRQKYPKMPQFEEESEDNKLSDAERFEAFAIAFNHAKKK